MLAKMHHNHKKFNKQKPFETQKAFQHNGDIQAIDQPPLYQTSAIIASFNYIQLVPYRYSKLSFQDSVNN